MNPHLEYLPPEKEESFFVKEFDLPYFGTPWHYHPEFEIVLVVRSTGTRIIGNSITEFGNGDLSFFGPNLPHIYKNGEEYYASNPAFRAESIVIHFSEASFGKGFLDLPQSKKLHSLFERSRFGIDIFGSSKELIIKKMREMLRVNSLHRLIILLEILNVLADSSEYALISPTAIEGFNVVDTDRIDKVFQYVLKNFHREITLEEISELVCMTRTSFCRFFLARTKRRFSEFLIDFRLSHASKMLIGTGKAISEISMDCGYGTLTNFNRQFKDKYKLSPKDYRRLVKQSNQTING